MLGTASRSGGEPVPRVLGEEAQRDVVGRAAPALQREQLRRRARDVRGDGEQVAGAHPGGQQRLVGVAEGRVGDGDRGLLPQPPREPLGAQLAQELPGPVGGGAWPSPSAAACRRGSTTCGRRAVRPVDRRLGEVAQDAGAAVGGLAGAQQLGALVDEARGDPARLEVRVVEDGGQERQVRRDAADAELRDRAAGPAHGLLEVVAVAGELDQHRVEVRADLGAGVRRAAVEPHAGAARRAVVADHAGVGAELVGRVLGGDAALQRGARERHLVLGEVQLGQRHRRRRSAAAR